MMNIKYFLLLTLISFSYPAFHCLFSQKVCYPYTKPQVSHCKMGFGNMCLECEENYSLSNDRTSCINFPNCKVFSDNVDEVKCSQCEMYYNFDSKGNCVKDYCQLYHEDGGCYYCYQGFFPNSNRQCEKINIDYCLKKDGDKCAGCAIGTKLENGICKVETDFIEGCERKNSDGTCDECNEYYELNNGKCTFKNQCQGQSIYEMCLGCEDGYYLATDRLYKCIGYDGSRENSGSNNADSNKVEGIKINLAFIYLLLALI